MPFAYRKGALLLKLASRLRFGAQPNVRALLKTGDAGVFEGVVELSAL